MFSDIAVFLAVIGLMISILNFFHMIKQFNISNNKASAVLHILFVLVGFFLMISYLTWDFSHVKSFLSGGVTRAAIFVFCRKSTSDE